MFNTLWYYSLTKPFLTPPSEIFPPVWILLYAAIFLSLIIYTIKPARNKHRGYIYFIIQMFLNLIWSPAFFILHNMILALLIILLLDLFVFLTVKRFFAVSILSGIILLPYLIWILFATYLNIAFIIIN